MRYSFGDWTLDTQLYTLHRAGHSLRLRPKVFQVLTYLVAHRDRVVSRQELCEQVWPDQFISDAALESAIRAARQALGDSGRTQQYIQTLHGHGYRFIAPVHCLPAAAAPAESAAPHGAPSLLFRRPPYFVGRDAALAQLAQWWTAVCQGTRQVGLIAGEAGIGKTALVEAFVAQVATTAEVWVG